MAGALITTFAPDFRAALPGGGALLGLDLGTQTIGTAFCDAGWRFASPGKTLKRGKFGADRQALAALVAERSVRGVVIGLPLNMDGSEGPRSQSSRAYARNVAEALDLPMSRVRAVATTAPATNPAWFAPSTYITFSTHAKPRLAATPYTTPS